MENTERNGFYILIFGILIGIVVSYSSLLPFILGLIIGFLSTQRGLFDYIDDTMKKISLLIHHTG